MRPSFAHVDSNAKAKAEAEAAGGDPSSPDAAAAAAPPDKKLQAVGFKKRESERSIRAKRESYEAKRQQEESEPWRHLSVQPLETASAAAEFERMFCDDDAQARSPIAFPPSAAPAAAAGAAPPPPPGAAAAAGGGGASPS